MSERPRFDHNHEAGVNGIERECIECISQRYEAHGWTSEDGYHWRQPGAAPERKPPAMPAPLDENGEVDDDDDTKTSDQTRATAFLLYKCKGEVMVEDLRLSIPDLVRQFRLIRRDERRRGRAVLWEARAEPEKYKAVETTLTASGRLAMARMEGREEERDEIVRYIRTYFLANALADHIAAGAHHTMQIEHEKTLDTTAELER